MFLVWVRRNAPPLRTPQRRPFTPLRLTCGLDGETQLGRQGLSLVRVKTRPRSIGAKGRRSRRALGGGPAKTQELLRGPGSYESLAAAISQLLGERE
mgnify:CR=1 FL=1